MSYTYTTFQAALAIEMAVPNNDPTDPQFAAVLPTLIDQAEQRCYRDLDLLAARGDWFGTLTTGNANFDISSGTLISAPAITASTFFTNDYAAIYMPPNPGTVFPGMTVTDLTTGIVLGAVYDYGPSNKVDSVRTQYFAGDTTITMLHEGWRVALPGMQVFDEEHGGALIGTVSSYIGATLTLAAPAPINSGGPSHLTFSSGTQNVMFIFLAGGPLGPLPANSAGTADVLAFTTGSAGLLPLPLTVERVKILTPPTAPPCTPVSPEWLDEVFGQGGPQGVPRYFAMTTQNSLSFGPIPDQPYGVDIYGMYRPVPLYLASPGDGTQTSFLTSVLPDLFLAAAMCAGSAYQKNWGAQSDDPRQAMSWEQSYQGLLGSAKGEEMRKKFHGWLGMTSEQPAPGPGPG